MIKRLILFLLMSILTACASLHPVPDDENQDFAFVHCGGELWGYVFPLNENGVASLAVFMHMHSVHEKDPAHSLTLHYAIKTMDNITFQMPNSNFTVQLEREAPRTFSFPLAWVKAGDEVNPTQPQRIFEKPVTVTLDGPPFHKIFIFGSKNIWPENRELANTKFTVSIPTYVVNGVPFPAKTYQFDMNYEDVRRRRISYGACPSTDEIFRKAR